MTYHINPENGNVNQCTATIRGCQFAADGQLPEHYDTKEEARKAYEDKMKNAFSSDLVDHIFEDGSKVKIISEKTLKSVLSKTTPYTQWNKSLILLKEEHDDFKLNIKVTDKLINSPKFQIRNFLIEHNNFAFSRAHLLMIEDRLVKENKSGDIIQIINKTDQEGLKRYTFQKNRQTYYSIPKVVFTDKHLAKRKNYTTKDEVIANETRQRLYFNDLSNDDYEIGHKDPRLPLTVENMVMQPSEINRSYKDNYIFDHNGLPKAPNPEAFAKNPEKFYNKEDLKTLYQALNDFFNK